MEHWAKLLILINKLAKNLKFRSSSRMTSEYIRQESEPRQPFLFIFIFRARKGDE